MLIDEIMKIKLQVSPHIQQINYLHREPVQEFPSFRIDYFQIKIHFKIRLNF